MYFFYKNIIGPALARQAFPCSHVLGHSEKCGRLHLSPQSTGLQEATAGSDHPKLSLGSQSSSTVLLATARPGLAELPNLVPPSVTPSES